MVASDGDDKLKIWLEDRNLQANVDYTSVAVQVGMVYYFFKSAVMAMMFKLTWGG